MILSQYYPEIKLAESVGYYNVEFAKTQIDRYTVGVWKVKNNN
jgi:hypothetical protein